MLEKRLCQQSIYCLHSLCGQVPTGLGPIHVGDPSSNRNVRGMLWSVPANVSWQKETTFVFAGKGRKGEGA